MKQLCIDMTGLGLTDVKNYIQSGNVVFTASQDASTVRKKLEALFVQEYTITTKILVISKSKYLEIVSEMPKGFGSPSEVLKYDVIFLDSNIDDATTIAPLLEDQSRDRLVYRPGAVFMVRNMEYSSSKARSTLLKSAFYPHITIRNYNTTMKLREMLEEME